MSLLFSENNVFGPKGSSTCPWFPQLCYGVPNGLQLPSLTSIKCPGDISDLPVQGLLGKHKNKAGTQALRELVGLSSLSVFLIGALCLGCEAILYTTSFPTL